MVPVLSADSLKSQLCPLHLGEQKLFASVQPEKVEGHNFSDLTVPTYIDYGGQRRQFETEVWLSYFRFVPKFEQWQFFVAFSHIPSNLSPDQKKDMRELFGKTLRSLSIDPFNG